MSNTVPRRNPTIHAPDPAAKPAPVPAPRDDRQLRFADLLRRPGRVARADLSAVAKVHAPALKADVAPGWPLQGGLDVQDAEEADATLLAELPPAADAAAHEEAGDTNEGDDPPEGDEGSGDGDGDGGGDELAAPAGETGMAAGAVAAGVLLGGAAAAAGAEIRIDARGLAVVDYLAATVTGFCNAPGVSSSDGWRVRIDLNADILPATTLHLNLSPHWLLLRFECADAHAKSLVCTHQNRLVTALDNALSPRRDISIDID
jgi:hypothetical protein